MSRAADTPVPTPPRLRLAVLVGVPLLAALAQAPGLFGDFVWDDRPLILEGRTVDSLDALVDAFTSDFFVRHDSDLAYGYYRPVITLSYALDLALGGPRPFLFHLTNALLHAASSLLVLLIALRLGAALEAAALGAALFAAHPMHVENVAWIAGRTDMVAFVFAAAAWLCHFRALDRAALSRPGILLRAGAAALFGLALLSKEMSAVLPAWIALALWLARSLSWRRVLAETAPFALVLAAYGLWRFAVIDVPAPGQAAAAGAFATALSALPTMVRYLGWLVLPVDQSPYVQNPYVTHLTDPRLLGSAALVALIAVILVKRSRGRRDVILLVLMLAASFGPILNFVRLAGPEDMGAIMAERFLYFPSFPFAALVGLGLATMLRRAALRGRSSSSWARGAAALLVAVLSLATMCETRSWRDDVTLFKKAIAHAPDSPLMWGCLANAYTRLQDWDAADRALRSAEKLGPINPTASWRVTWLVAQGQLAEAIPLQEQIAKNAVQSRAVAENNLAFLYRATGEPERAQGILDAIAARGEAYADVHFNLAEIHKAAGRTAQARLAYARARELKRKDLKIGAAAAALEMSEGRLDAASAVFEELLEYHPENAGLLSNLGVIYSRKGDRSRAERMFEEAIALDPGYARAHSNFADLLDEMGRRSEAARERAAAQRATKRGSPSPEEE